MTFAIGAAGTGGHVYPALAVAEELVAAGVGREDVFFFGGDRLEATVVPAAGFPLVSLELRGLRRALSPSNLGIPFLVLRAARRAADELRRRGALAVLGMGGYVMGPVALAARRRGLPLVVHEQNARPGLGNRLAARLAARTLAAFPTASLPGAEVVGNPLRPGLARFSRKELRPAALERYGLDPALPTVGILGGSLGARSLNEAAAMMAAGWSEPPAQFLHLAGRPHAQALAERAAAFPAWSVLPFEESMEHFYAASDLVVCRAGASTVSELAATATPAVLVPPSLLARLGQEANAAHLVEAGAGELLPEERLGELAGVVARLIGDEEARRAMSKAAAGLARPEAGRRVAEVLLEVADG